MRNFIKFISLLIFIAMDIGGTFGAMFYWVKGDFERATFYLLLSLSATYTIINFFKEEATDE
jgi:hypothetical protein